MTNNKEILVTGAAGFIGSALTKLLLKNGKNVVGIDNLNSYYSTKLKNDRLNNIDKFSKSTKGNWSFIKADIQNKYEIEEIFKKYSPEIIINLAAQAGVRYSIINPSSYLESNLIGFSNLLEICRKYEIKHLIFASSSSVYGGNKKLPFKESDAVDHPISFYAATKKANEIMAHSYSHLYDIPCTGLRFFTVYGPWGRPDMAPMIFAKAIIEKKPIKIFNYGNMKRDFTYIDDIVEGIYKCTEKIATKDLDFNFDRPNISSSFSPYRIFNIGNNTSVNLPYFIELLESCLGIKAIKDFQPMQSGDIENTFADISLIKKWVGFKPKVSIEIGIERFSKWFLDYYGIKK